MPPCPRKGVENLEACYHGGPDYAELEALGFSPENVLDFSSNTNPFGPPAEIREILTRVDISQYPDSNATELRQALATDLGLSPSNVIVGAGSTELLRLIALAYLEQGDRAALIEPTFGEYEAACRVVGASVVKDTLSVEGGFQLRVEQIVSLIERSSPKIVFLCNPNNPTGQYLSQGEVEQILNAGHDSLIVLDEAYVPFVENPWSSVDMIDRNNLVIIRSMTKDFALTGLRLGYALAHEEIIANLKRVCPPWNVNVLALNAGMAVLGCGDYLDWCSGKLREAKRYLVQQLTERGYMILSSSANFFLMEVGDAEWFRQVLLKQGILVRDCTSFGLPRYVRIAPRTLRECETLVEAIGKL